MLMELFYALIVLLIIKGIANMYRIVDVSEAHIVITPKRKMIISSDKSIGEKNWYFNIPKTIPFIGRSVRRIDVSVHESVIKQETYEKGQARYYVTSSTKYKVHDVSTAAETFRSFEELTAFLKEIIEASVRAVTVKYEIETARANKTVIENDIRNEMEDDFARFGLKIQNFNLVDFQDTESSKIVSSISQRREAEITSNTAIEVAERNKAARVKQAEANQSASIREIEAQQMISERDQQRIKKIEIERREAETQRLEVVKVQTLKQQEIDKEKAIILAEQESATASILKEKLQQEGLGMRLKAEEIAKGEAAAIRENLVAEADGKAKLQEALSGFDTNAINAMVAQQVVEAQKAIGLAGADALRQAEVKIFVGDGGKQGFDIGQLVSSVRVSDTSTADALLHRITAPNDIGFGLSKNNKVEKNIEKVVSGE